MRIGAHYSNPTPQYHASRTPPRPLLKYGYQAPRSYNIATSLVVLHPALSAHQSSEHGDTVHISDVARQKANESNPSTGSVAENFLGGLWNNVKDTGTGILRVVEHPMQTAEGIVHAVEHPTETVKSVVSGVKQGIHDVAHGNANEKAHAYGELVGTVATSLIPGGVIGKGAKALTTVARAAEDAGNVEKLANGAKDASEVGKVGAVNVSAVTDKSEKLVVANKDFLKPDGRIKWPADGGFEGGKYDLTKLEPGTKVDRYGNTVGSFVAPKGTPYAERSLPYVENPNAYHAYEVTKPIPDVKMGKAAPAFNQPGGGMQYQLPHNVNYLLNNGYLKEAK